MNESWHFNELTDRDCSCLVELSRNVFEVDSFSFIHTKVKISFSAFERTDSKTTLNIQQVLRLEKSLVVTPSSSFEGRKYYFLAFALRNVLRFHAENVDAKCPISQKSEKKISKVMTETLRMVKKTCTSRFLTLVWTTIFNPHLTIALSVKSSISHNNTIFVNICHSKVGFRPSQAQTFPVSRFVLSSYMKENKSLIVCVASFLTFNTN